MVTQALGAAANRRIISAQQNTQLRLKQELKVSANCQGSGMHSQAGWSTTWVQDCAGARLSEEPRAVGCQTGGHKGARLCDSQPFVGIKTQSAFGSAFELANAMNASLFKPFVRCGDARLSHILDTISW